MGANVSNSLYDSVYRSTYAAFTTTTTSLVQQQEGNVDIIQNVAINVMGEISCGSFNVEQSAKGTLTVVSQLNQQAMADITNSIINEISRNVTTTLQQTNNGINIGQANVANVVNKTVSAMGTQISTTVAQSVKQVVSVSGTIQQSITLNVFPGARLSVNGACNVTQDATMDVMAQSVADQVAQLTANNAQFNKLAEDFKTTLAQSNTGLTLGGMLLMLLAAVVGLVFVMWIVRKIMSAPGAAASAMVKKAA